MSRAMLFAAATSMLVGLGLGALMAPTREPLNRTDTPGNATSALPTLPATAQATTEPPTSSFVATTTTIATTESPPPTGGPDGESADVAVLVPELPPSRDEAVDIATRLAPGMRLPSDCVLPLDDPESLPNASRSYRSGVHQGIDFICKEGNRIAVAGRSGHIVAVINGYQDPPPDRRDLILATAEAVGSTPPWTLAMLYGNFVVIDHGLVDGIGHVVTLYAHLANVDSAIVPGASVSAGDRLGEIGNTGTSTAASNGSRPESLHLHWEVYVDSVYLGAGLDQSGTRDVYLALFPLIRN